MKSKLIAIMAVVLLLSLFNSCDCSRGSKTFVDMMKKVPVESTFFSYWAISGLSADEELQNMYAKFRESTEAKELKDIGVVLFTLRHSAKAFGSDGSVTVLGGDFNVKDIERRLEVKGYKETGYGGIGIWTPQDGGEYNPLTLQEDAILVGKTEDLKSCIDTMDQEQEYSLYEDQDIKWLTDKLPEGLIVNVYKADPAYGEAYVDLIAYGKSYKKEDQGRLKLTAVYMFQDSLTAGNAQAEIKDHLATEKFVDVRLERDGGFVRATAYIDITDFAQTLSF